MPEVTDPALLKLLNADTPSESGGPVYGAPKVETPRTADQTVGDQLSNKKTTLEIRGLEDKHAEDATKDAQDAAAEADKHSSAISGLRNVLDKIDNVALDSADNHGWFETGATGALAANFPGTAARDLRANIATIDANTAFDALQKMRAENKTGGALGNVSDQDMALLKQKIASLDPTQSQESFLANLASAKKTYLEMLGRVDPAAAAEYDNKPGIRFGKDGVPFLTSLTGPADKQARIDPFGVLNGTNPNGGGGDNPGGGPGGGPGTPQPDDGGWSLGGIAKRLGEGMGSIVEGVGDIPGALGGNALGTMAYRAAGYPQEYDMGKIARESLGLPANPNQTNGAIIEGASSALGGAAAARGLAGMVTGPASTALETFGRTPIADSVAGGGAAGGSELARRQGWGVPAQLGMSMVGGLTGYKGAGTVESMLAPRAPTQQALAAARQNVDMLPADAGGPVARIVTSAARASPISATPVVKAAQRSQAQTSAAARRAAESQGEITTTDAAGEAVAGAGKRLASKTRDIGNSLYRKAWDDPVASALTIPARNSLAKVDQLISDLRAAGSNTNSGAISNLQKLRADLVAGKTAKAMHDLRSDIREGIYDGGLRSGKEQGRMKAIGEAMTDDMLGYLDATGNKRTADTIRRADGYWKGRVEHIDQVLEPIIGKEGAKGGEQIVQTLESMARGSFGGNKRLSRLLKEMTPEESGRVRATIVDRIGKATPGQQNAEGTAFSASTFLTNWNKMTPQAKETLFANKALRQNLDDIALLSERMKASQSMANHSNTSAAMQGSAALQGGWAVAHFPSYVLGAGLQFVTGKLMASPGFARMLAKVPNNPAAARNFVEQLGVLATREPMIAADAKALQQHLAESLAQSPVRAAATEKEQDRGRVPPAK